MGTAQEIISGLMGLVGYAVLAFAVVKLYTISIEVTEIKDLLKDIKRNTEDQSPAFAARAQSPESLIRALNASAYAASEVEHGEISK